MQAVVVREHGPVAALEVEADVPPPNPERGEVLVRVEVAGVNFIDVYHRVGRYPQPLPFIPGREGAGVILDVGDGVDRRRIGERVAWASGRMGSYAEFATLPAWRAVTLPSEVATHTAAAVMLQGMTAHYLCRSTFELASGHTALVHAAAGGTGRLLVQMAKALGARVLATASTPERRALVRDLGVDAVADYAETVAMVDEHTDGRGVDVAYDGVGAATFDASLRSLRARGLFVLFGASSGPVSSVSPAQLMRAGAVYFTRPTLIPSYLQSPAEVQWRAGDVLGAVVRRELHVAIDSVHPLKDVAIAHGLLESRSTIGKVLLTNQSGWT